jgi:hypothetical protein
MTKLYQNYIAGTGRNLDGIQAGKINDSIHLIVQVPHVAAASELLTNLL